MKKENCSIAEFMELKKEKRFFNYKTGNYLKKETDDCDVSPTFVYIKNGSPVVELLYHKSFDWLMPVVEKIESLGISVQIEGQYNVFNKKVYNYTIIVWKKYENVSCSCATGEICIYNQSTSFSENKLNSVYEAVVNFIDWYNNNKH